MATYERSARVRAPLEAVWEFHDSPAGLAALTPDWLCLAVEAVHGPDGDPDPDELRPGTTLRLSLRPFGVGPRTSWTSRIVAREREDGSASFRDVMTDGPFREWEHTHSFYADGPETVVRDRVRYEFPFGGLGRAVGRLGVVGFEPMFRYRHRRTRDLLE
jgi:ligand-binding SRPBCC domain-containing protein